VVECGVRLTAHSEGRLRHGAGGSVLLDFSQAVGHVFDRDGQRLGSLSGLQSASSRAYAVDRS
jgi:hypothetical protein